MRASKSGTFPICRLSSDEFHKIADVFVDISKDAPSDDNPIFRFETMAETYTTDEPVLQSRRISQREVKAIEMLAKNDRVSARLYLDLEEGPVIIVSGPPGTPAPPPRSKLEVQGDEGEVFRIWDELTALVKYRGSPLATAMHAGLGFVLFLGMIAALIALAAISINRLHATDPLQTIVIGFIVAVAILVPVTFIGAGTLNVLWSRVQVDGWGRFEKRRGAIQWWSGALVAGLIAWAIGLGIQWLATG